MDADGAESYVGLFEEVTAPLADMGWNTHLYSEAQARRKVLHVRRAAGESLLPPTLRLHNVYGTGTPTPIGLRYDLPRPGRKEKRGSGGLAGLTGVDPAYTHGNGDFLVAAQSAAADGLGAVSSVAVPRMNHVELVFAASTFETIAGLLAEGDA